MSDSATHSTSRIMQICHCLEADQEEQPARLAPPQGQRTRLPEERGWKRMQAKAPWVVPAPVILTIRLGSRPPREVRLTIPANETDMPYYLVYSYQMWTEQVPTCSHITPGTRPSSRIYWVQRSRRSQMSSYWVQLSAWCTPDSVQEDKASPRRKRQR